MTENSSGPVIPGKPTGPPSFNHTPGEDALASTHPAHIRNVRSKLRMRRLNKKGTGALEPAKTAQALNSPVPGHARPASRKVAWYWVAGAAATLLGGGVLMGTTLPDPTESSQYATLQSQKDGVRGELDSLQARFNNLSAGMKDRETAVATREAAVAKNATEVKTAEAAVKAREEAVTAAEKTKAANTIKEGTWTVGVDIEPGTYRAAAEVPSTCYWGIYRTGSNGSDIIDNDIVSGGRPSVTLSPGQDFNTTRCGSWNKQ